METFKEWAEAQGFTYWPGGDNPPADLDHTWAVLLRDNSRTKSFLIPDWRHIGDRADIIGYQRRPEPTFKLELTAEEIAALRLILSTIGGDRQQTPREHADSILNKIPQGVSQPLASRACDGDNTLYFRPYSELSPHFENLVHTIRTEISQ